MSNLSRLEAVSDALDTAISTANSLPEAGGGGSELQIATGTFTATDAFLYNTPIQISGLLFKPKIVMIRVKNQATATTLEYVLAYAFKSDGLDAMCGGIYFPGSSASKIQQLSASTYVNLNDDGFTLGSTNQGVKTFGGTYDYVAIG